MTRVLMWQAQDAGGDAAPYRIAAMGSADGKVVQAAGARTPLIGVFGRAGGKAGARVEIARVGVAEVEYGAAVGRGDLLTADADGKAVPVEGPAIFQATVAGAAADTDIAVDGILADDELVGVSATDATAVTGPAIHTDGNIRATGSTAGKTLIVAWRRPQHIVGQAEFSGAAGDIGQALLAPGVL